MMAAFLRYAPFNPLLLIYNAWNFNAMFKKEGYIGHLILDNPEQHNAFDDKLIQTLIKDLETIEQDDTIRVVMLSAEGVSFSAGANLHWMRKVANYSAEENVEDALKLARLMQKLNTLNKPTIALVQGNAYGGALGLIACCDVVLSSPHALYCFSEVKLGLIPAVISPYIMATIGFSQTRRYFITAERFSAHEALNIGLIHLLSDNLMEDGLHLAKQIAQNSPAAIKQIKALLHATVNRPIDDTLIQQTAEAIARSRVSKEGQEGLNAFLEKRKPSWHS